VRAAINSAREAADDYDASVGQVATSFTAI
jgi:hypothetical protein